MTTTSPPSIKSIHSQTLDLPPSCIQFCPSRPGVVCVGTYFLHLKEQEGDLSSGRNADSEGTNNTAGADTENDEETEDAKEVIAAPQKRTGSLILFRLGDKDDNITCLSTLPTDYAVLDLQWKEDILAVAASTAKVVFYQLSSSDELVELKTITISDDPTILVLSLTWHPTREHVLGLTLSDGKVLLLRSEYPLWSQDANATVVLSEVHRHELEAWICAFSSAASEDELQVFSGGDDILLKCSSVQAEAEESMQVWQDRGKLHQAGITYILPLPLSEDLLVTGSYDDHIRLLHTPQIGRRKCLAELYLGGGVWRLKVLHHHSQPNDSITSFVLLASCMHAGSRIVRAIRTESEDEWRFEVLAMFEEHQSMNYGSDAVMDREGDWKIVSTSFYDKLMCLWRWGDGEREGEGNR